MKYILVRTCSPPFSGLPAEEGSKHKCVLTEYKLLVHYLSLLECLLARVKHNPRRSSRNHLQSIRQSGTLED